MPETLEHAFFGSIDVTAEHVELRSLPTATGDRIRVGIEMTEQQPSPEELDALATACRKHESWVRRALGRIEERHADRLLADIERWHPGLLADEGEREPTASELVTLLRPRDLMLWPGTDAPLVLDFGLPLTQPSDHVVSARFGVDGELASVTLES
ncbi:MAG: hypothetical protein AAF533_01170 [Acidobacteriota bacterium]